MSNHNDQERSPPKPHYVTVPVLCEKCRTSGRICVDKENPCRIKRDECEADQHE